MGKRSRKRVEVEASPTSRAERDAARVRRAAEVERRRAAGRPAPKPRPGRTSIDDRPPAPWGNFPLVELAVLAGIILLIAGFIVRGDRGVTMIVAGMAVASLAGLELSIREHFSGFRSHTTLLAGAVALAVIGATYFVSDKNQVAMLAAAAVAFLGAFLVFRRVFTHRSGGVAFRR
jgi:uncharacterized membrane protein